MKPIDPRILAKAEKIMAHKFAAANEMVTDIGQRMMRDQTEWLDKQMEDILTPELYQKGKRGEGESEIAEYVKKHRIKIVFVPDSLMIRIMIGDRVHSQFLPRLLLDGEPIEFKREGPTLDQN